MAQDLSGSYLSLAFAPTPEVAQEAGRLRQQLGFVDLTHAVPPRRGDELHVTIGYFRKLSSRDADFLAKQFRGKEAPLTIDGYGVAKNQVAYFTVMGAEQARDTLRGADLRFEADDPHITFAVNPGNPRDVHGVPKKALQPLEPIRLRATYHLQQGKNTIW